MRTLLRVLGIAAISGGLLAAMAMSASAQQEIEQLCVNRVTGVVRDGSAGCSRFEQAINVDQGAPFELYVNVVTGVHRYGANPSRYEMPVPIDGDGSYDVCVSRLNGYLYPFNGGCSRYAVHKVI